jgi:hypothetical protein
MSWHYRIRKRIVDDEPVFDIVEMYNNPQGTFRVWTEEGMQPIGDTKEKVIQTLKHMLKDAKKYSVLHDKIEEDIMKKVIEISGNDSTGSGIITITMVGSTVKSPLAFDFVSENGKRRYHFNVHSENCRELAAFLVSVT